MKAIKYKKIGGGTVTLYSGKVAKQNEVLTAKPDDIPNSFRDLFVALEDEPDPQAPVKESEIITHDYSVEAKGKGWFNVVDGNGKVMNTKSLREDAANKLVTELKGLSNG